MKNNREMRQHFPVRLKINPVLTYRLIINQSLQKYEKNYGIGREYKISRAEKIIQNNETNDLFDFDFSGLCFCRQQLFPVKED
jgi:hypothetical protein